MPEEKVRGRTRQRPRGIHRLMQLSRQPSFTDTQASVLLDLLRGLAALLAAGSHWRNMLFVDYSSLPARRHLLYLPFYLLTTQGHRTVVIFFVLSGYLISSSIFRMLAKGQWSWSRYATHRLVRLWIVLLPCLLLTVFWDHLGMHLHQAPLLYAGGVQNHEIQDITTHNGWHVLAGNALFLQGIIVPVYASNTPLWSLAYEFWYYVLFPLAWISLRVPAALWQRGALLLTFAVAARFIGPGMLMSFSIWCLGVVLVWLPLAPDSRGTRMACGLVQVACLYGLPNHGFFSSDFFFGCVTAGCIWMMLGARQAAPKHSLFTRGSRALSRFSFTLYVSHMPLLLFVVSLTVHDKRWIPGPVPLIFAVAIFALVLVYAWVVAASTEFRTDRVRGWIEKRLGLRRDDPTPHERALAT
jgi:peptidoglycan/LPS O-acetylase OafA/YrhL